MAVGEPGGSFQARLRPLANVEVMLSSSQSVHWTRATPYQKVGSKHALTTCSNWWGCVPASANTDFQVKVFVRVRLGQGQQSLTIDGEAVNCTLGIVDGEAGPGVKPVEPADQSTHAFGSPREKCTVIDGGQGRGGDATAMFVAYVSTVE
eukprot:1629093-Rhodomonas_salina.1